MKSEENEKASWRMKNGGEWRMQNGEWKILCVDIFGACFFCGLELNCSFAWGCDIESEGPEGSVEYCSSDSCGEKFGSSWWT